MTEQHNPKHIQAQKDGKAPLEYLVTSMDELDAAVHKHGADKYGIRNWRIDKILASTYVGAMRRHLNAWAEGHDLDDGPGGSGKPHLTHLRACCAVVLDAQLHDTLIDDRGRAESKGQVVVPVPMPDGSYGTMPSNGGLGSFAPRMQGYPNPRCSACQLDPCGCVKG